MAKSQKKETFEAALGRLEGIAERLERGDLTLEEALKAYEEGVKAYRHCAAILAEVEKRIEVLTKTADGKLAAEEASDLEPEK